MLMLSCQLLVASAAALLHTPLITRPTALGRTLITRMDASDDEDAFPPCVRKEVKRDKSQVKPRVS